MFEDLLRSGLWRYARVCITPDVYLAITNDFEWPFQNHKSVTSESGVSGFEHRRIELFQTIHAIPTRQSRHSRIDTPKMSIVVRSVRTMTPLILAGRGGVRFALQRIKTQEEKVRSIPYD